MTNQARATLLSAVTLATAACTGSQGPIIPATTQPGACRNEQLDRFTGLKATAELGAQALSASGAKTLRWGGPGMAMTMDFRADRLTVSYDDGMIVTSARCG